MTTNKPGSVNQRPLYGCTSCFEDFSWPASDLRVYGGECWCGLCWDERRWGLPDLPYWDDLEPYTPALQAECEKLRKDVAGLLICDECHDKCADPYTGLFASHCPDEEPCIMCECSSLRRQLAEQQPVVSALAEALECFVEWYEQVNLRNEPCFQFYDKSKKALAAHRKGGEV